MASSLLLGTYKTLWRYYNSFSLSGQRIIEEASRQLFERIFHVESFSEIINTPRVDLNGLKFTFTVRMCKQCFGKSEPQSK